MSPIEGLSDIRRLPRLGKIRLGIKKEGLKGFYPSPTNYFVCPDEVKAVYSDQPKELKVMFPSDNLELVAPQFMKCYSYSQGLICRGNGKTCRRKVDVDTGDFANKETRQWEMADGLCGPSDCPMVAQKQCRRVMSLLFILYEVAGLGVYQLDTTSFYSIVNINSQLAPDGFIRPFTNGRIAFIPLILSVGPQEVTPPGVGRKTVHVLSVRADVKLADIIRISRQGPAQVLLPTLSEEEPPEDLFPEEVLEPAEETPTATVAEETPTATVAEETATPTEEGETEPLLLTKEKGKTVELAAPPVDQVDVDRQRILDSAKVLDFTDAKLKAYLQDRCKDKAVTTVDKVPDELVFKLASELADWELMK